jgi:hypothetical protein
MDSINQAIADKINGYIASVSSGKSTRSELIEAAFRAIQTDRQSKCLDDVVTTSAEHYLFARWVVGDNFLMLAPLCEAAFPLYDALKYIGIKVKASDCPVSEYDGHHTLWKEYGCSAGSTDYWRQRAVPPPKVTRYGG